MNKNIVNESLVAKFSAEYTKFRTACEQLKRYHRDNDVVNMMMCNGEIIAYIEKMKDLLIEDREGKILQQVKDFKTDLYYLYDTFERVEPNFVTGGNANIVLVYVILDCKFAYDLNLHYKEYLEWVREGNKDEWIQQRWKKTVADPIRYAWYRKSFEKTILSDQGYDITRFMDEEFLEAMKQVIDMK